MDTKSISILLIEDEPDDAVLIKRYLSSSSRVTYALNHVDMLRKGLDCLSEGGIDIVLLDLGLPDGQGLGSFDAVHRLVPHVPVIVLTGHDDDDIADEAVHKGAQDFIVKGRVDGGLLQRAIRYAIERNKLLSERKRATEELTRLNGLLEYQAATDSLTGISNRLRFGETLAKELSRSKRYALSLSLIMFDIDHFKRINDTCGHQAGDRILCEITALVAMHVRVHDLFARWGGEEFMIMVANVGLEGARMFAEKLRLLIESHAFPEVGSVTCSFGVAQFEDDESADKILQRVDAALYRAKALGRNRIEAV